MMCYALAIIFLLSQTTIMAVEPVERNSPKGGDLGWIWSEVEPYTLMKTVDYNSFQVVLKSTNRMTLMKFGNSISSSTSNQAHSQSINYGKDHYGDIGVRFFSKTSPVEQFELERNSWHSASSASRLEGSYDFRMRWSEREVNSGRFEKDMKVLWPFAFDGHVFFSPNDNYSATSSYLHYGQLTYIPPWVPIKPGFIDELISRNLVSWNPSASASFPAIIDDVWSVIDARSYLSSPRAQSSSAALNGIAGVKDRRIRRVLLGTWLLAPKSNQLTSASFSVSLTNLTKDGNDFLNEDLIVVGIGEQQWNAPNKMSPELIAPVTLAANQLRSRDPLNRYLVFFDYYLQKL